MQVVEHMISGHRASGTLTIRALVFQALRNKLYAVSSNVYSAHVMMTGGKSKDPEEEEEPA